MGEKLQLDEHARVDRLLPWFVNNTIDDGERDRIRRHLDTCDACRKSVSLLSAVQDSIQRGTATPIVPRPQTDRLLEKIDTHVSKGRKTRMLTIFASAASVAAVLILFNLLLPARERTVSEPARYETTTSPVQRTSMNYVLDVQFEAGVSPAAQQRVLAGLQAKEITSAGSDGVYRITVNLPASSLEELELFTSELEGASEIRAVHAVAVQLPVKTGQ
ncbi:MAG TPA: anti-sigma factor [Woeseiaceae bacterium]|nr:anti-sigma factor [Woeseiaceae bacterium]